MQFKRLIGILTRDDLVAQYGPQTKTLLILPDNLSDSRRPFTTLHQGLRGGVAGVMRPNVIKKGGKYTYDLHCVGVPSMNDDTSVPNEENVMRAFERVYYLLGTGAYTNVAVPFRKSHFGSDAHEVSFRGQNAPWDKNAQEMFNLHFKFLEDFLNSDEELEVKLEKIPQAYQRAYLLGVQSDDHDPINNALNENSAQEQLSQAYDPDAPVVHISHVQKLANALSQKLPVLEKKREESKRVVKEEAISTEPQLETFFSVSAPQEAQLTHVQSLPEHSSQPPPVSTSENHSEVMAPPQIVSESDIFQDTASPSLTVMKKSKDEYEREREFPLSADDYRVYQTHFKGDPYIQLADLIEKRNKEVSHGKFQGQTHEFKKSLKHILPVIEFACKGAQHELELAKKNKNQKAINEVSQRLDAFQKIYALFSSLQALANNHSRYSERQYAHKINEIMNMLNKQNVDENSRLFLKKVLDEIITKELYQGRRFYQTSGMGSTVFDTQDEKSDLGEFKKRIKVEHENHGQVVKVQFDISRRTLLGTSLLGGHLKFGSSKNELKKLNSQVTDFVTIAINEYNKGSKSNPIQIKYLGSSKPDIALAALMEFKKRAVIENKTFYAKDKDGKLIEITPRISFTPNEQAYFMSFAMEKPTVQSWTGGLNKANRNAGYKLFKHVKVGELDSKMSSKQAKSHSAVFHAMQTYLENEVEKFGSKQQARMEKVSQELTNKAPKMAQTQTGPS